jgi:hypothetical protein
MRLVEEDRHVKKIAALVLGMVVAAFVFAPTAMAAEKEKKEGKQDEKIALDQVPAAVKTAAEGAVKGIVISEAEKEVKKGVTVYELTGKADGKEYEVKVGADAKVIKVKEKKAGDKDDDGDDDDDDDKGGGKKEGKK